MLANSGAGGGEGLLVKCQELCNVSFSFAGGFFRTEIRPRSSLPLVEVGKL